MFSILKKQTYFTIRHLGEHSYGTSVARGAEFANTMKTLSAKGKQLKKEGKGNKDAAADQLTDQEIEMLYQKGQLGNCTPSSLINTLWLNNTTHFGIRGGGTEHRY